MSDIVKILPYSIDLNETIKKTELHTLFVMDDSLAHRFELTITNGGEAVNLEGATVKGYFTNFKEKTTIEVEGKHENCKAIVTLNKPCYTLHGQFVLIIQVKIGDVEASIFEGEGFMRTKKAEKIVYEDFVIYDVDTLLAQIADMKNATTEAKEATQASKEQTEAAKKATDDADEAAKSADGWARATISVTKLAAGSEPTASVNTASDGHKVITLGIPKGDTGATPQITFEVATGQPGTDVQIKVSGTAEAPHVLLTIPKGDTGSIENLSINGKPVESGNITLTAEDVDALPSSGTAEDASKLGGKAPEYYIQPRNLLDNSDFRNPVNQRGATSYNQAGYTIDRWTNNVSLLAQTLNSNGLTLENNYTDYTAFEQHIPVGIIESGKTYTIAAHLTDGTVQLKTITAASGSYVTNGEAENGLNMFLAMTDDYDRCGFILDAGSTVSIKYAALYEGEYTADNLPPYVPKGYAAELAECKRYYQELGEDGYANHLGLSTIQASTNKYIRCLIPLPVEMRANPTMTYSGTINAYASEGKASTTIAAAIGCYKTAVGITAVFQIAEITASTWYQISTTAGARIYLSADL